VIVKVFVWLDFELPVTVTFAGLIDTVGAFVS